MRKQLTVGSLLPGRPITTGTQQAHTKSHSAAGHPASVPADRRQSAPPLVRVRQNGQEYSVRYSPHQTLLAAALAQGYPLAYKCQLGHCGKCSVQLIAGSSCLTPPTKQERVKLGGKLPQGYRLACQSSFPPTIPK